ncbi:MAG: hypothetical protein ACR2FE_00055 [Aeromicrobium sp.]
MWERAEGVTNDACRDPDAAKLDSVVSGVASGSTVEEVLRTAGQPHARLGDEFTYCTTTSSGAEKSVTVRFDEQGRVASAG